MKRTVSTCLMWCALVNLWGCGAYAVPGPAAQLSDLADWSVREEFDRKPLLTFPTNVAVIRVQGRDYESYTYRSNRDGGKYTIVTQRDVESNDKLKTLGELPRVEGIVFANRLVASNRVDSEKDIRNIAARLQSKLVFLYTIDTSFRVTDAATPLAAVSLGLFPTSNAHVNSTASAILLDTQSGYIYGTLEATAKRDQAANSWTSEAAVDQSRLITEAEAFNKLIDQVPAAWTQLLAKYDKATPAATTAAPETPAGTPAKP